MQPSHVLLDGRPDPRRADPVDRLHPKEVALEHEPPNARECTNVSSRLCHRPAPTATRSRPDARRELHKRAGNRSKNASVREMRGAALIPRFTRSKRGTRSREMFARTSSSLSARRSMYIESRCSRRRDLFDRSIRRISPWYFASAASSSRRRSMLSFFLASALLKRASPGGGRGYRNALSRPMTRD